MASESLIGQEHIIYPLKFLGITHPFSGLTVDTLVNTWICILVIIIFVLIGRYLLFKQDTLPQYFIKSFAKNFIELIEQTTGVFIDRYFYFITSLFIFILTCNWISLIPGIEEPTKDLNTTLALGIIAFIYMHKEIVKSHGFTEYLKEFFMPVKVFFPLNLIIGLIILPLKLLEELATVVSMSFRLFGNIFGGFIISHMYFSVLSNWPIAYIFGLLSGLNLIIAGFFIIFEGFLQAFVFSILTLTNISRAIETNKESHP